jgi:PAS domain S-box-containing protein
MLSKDDCNNMTNRLMNALIVVSCDGKIEKANKAACRLLGYEEKELINQPFELIFKGQAALDVIKPGALLPNDLVLAGRSEKIYISKSGEKIPVLFSVTPLGDAEDRPAGFVCEAQDIRDRKRTEELLWESEARYRRLVDNIDLGINLIDLDYNIVRVNHHGSVTGNS